MITVTINGRCSSIRHVSGGKKLRTKPRSVFLPVRPENVGPGEDYLTIFTSKRDVLDGTDIVKSLKIYGVKLLNFILDKFEKILVSFTAANQT